MDHKDHQLAFAILRDDDEEIGEPISIAEVVGPYAWDQLHHLVESFPCGECAEEGASLMRFAHDLVNVKLGKKVHHPEDLIRWAGVVAHAREDLELPAHDDLPAPILAAMAQAVSTPCTGEARDRLESCVLQLKDRPDVDNPIAVCTASIGCTL